MRRDNRGTLIAFAVTLTPVLLWLAFAPHGSVFSSTYTILDSLARICGIAGLSLFSYVVILSGRLPFFDKLYHGLDKSFRAHHTFGVITLILLLFHSGLLITKYALLSLPTGYEFLTNTQDTALVVGKLAMILFVSLMIIALFVFVKYEWFIRVMRCLGVIIFLGGYHAIFVSGSDVRQTPILFAYMLLLGGTACLIYIYRSIFHKSFKGQYQYEVTQVQPINDVSSIHLKPIGRRLQHYAGQFAFIRIKSKQVKDEEHPFTISAGSSDDLLRFCIKASGDFTKTIHRIKVGDQVQVDGPYGQFSFTKMPGKHQIWVAGGIGITPFLSMSKSLPKHGYHIRLYYSVKTADEAIFVPELRKTATNIPDLEIIPWVTDKQGYLTAEAIAKESDLPKSEVLLCGPPPMMHALSDQFQKHGVKKDKIHYEEFSL